MTTRLHSQRARRTATTLMALLAIGTLGPTWVRERPARKAKPVHDLFSRERNPDVRSAGLTVVNYYDKDSDSLASRTVFSVEKNHLSENNFWAAYWAKRDARPALQFVLSYVPNHPKALYLLGVLSIEQDDVGLAVTYFERAVRRYPQHAITRAQYGNFLVQAGNVETGIMELESALRADPTLTMARGWLNEAHKKRNELAAGR